MSSIANRITLGNMAAPFLSVCVVYEKYSSFKNILSNICNLIFLISFIFWLHTGHMVMLCGSQAFDLA